MSNLTAVDETEAIEAPEDQVALFYAGDGSRFIPGIPTRDLTAFELSRIVYRRSVFKRDDRSGGHLPSDPEFGEALEALIENLTGGGMYSLTPPADVDAKPAKASKSKAAEPPPEAVPDVTETPSVQE